MRAIGGLFPLLIIGAIVYAIVHASRSRGPVEPARTTPRPPPTATATSARAPMATPRGLAADLDRWVAAGLVTEDQEDAILTYEGLLAAPADAAAAPAGAARPRRIPAVAEALGYLGGILAVTGLGLILSRYWPDMATAGRLGLSGGAAVALLGAGALAREAADPALARLRWFLWLAATAATGLFGGVAALDGLDAAPETVTLAAAAPVAVLSALLWRGRDRPLQQLTCLGGIAVTAGAAMAEIATGTPVGLAAWVVGTTFVGLGLRRVTRVPALTEGIGAIAVVVGSIIAATDTPAFGQLLMVASGFGLLALATVPDLAPDPVDQKVLGFIGGFTLLQGVPATLGWFSQDAGGPTGLVTWAIGGLLLLAGAQGRTRLPVLTELLGGAGLIGGAALTGVQWEGFAPLFGIATGVGLVALGMLPGQVLLSVLGSGGLLANVPWAIGRFFPGEGRAPLLIMVSGAMIIAIAVLLTRMGGRFRSDLGDMRRRRPPRGMVPRASH